MPHDCKPVALACESTVMVHLWKAAGVMFDGEVMHFPSYQYLETFCYGVSGML